MNKLMVACLMVVAVVLAGCAMYDPDYKPFETVTYEVSVPATNAPAK